MRNLERDGAANQTGGSAARGGLTRRLAEHVSVAGGGADGARAEIPVEEPFTGAEFGRVPRCGPEDVEEAARRARVAQRSWKHWSHADRARIFLRLHDLILDRREGALDLIQREGGKARRHGLEEVIDVALVSRYYAHTAARHLRPRRRQGAFPVVTTTREYRHPKGLVGFIVPWNYPLTLAISDAIPALLAGNAALVKPDSQTPFTALWVAELLYEAGLPRDLLQVVTGEGRELGEPIIENSDYLMFTGSTATGRILARQCGERLIDCSMELGGKNAMIVRRDADPKSASEGARRACFGAAGQLCISVERLYVHEDVYQEFIRDFVERTRSMQINGEIGYGAEMGSLVSADQLETVQGYVNDAVEKGAQVLAGGRHRPDLGPYFHEPTILTGVTPEMSLYAEETFGPVVYVESVASDNEAVEKANDSDYGLNFSIWTKDTEAGERLATQLETGTVNINEAYAATWGSTDAPMGGFKDSGLGRRHGAEGILKYTEAQTVSTQRVLPMAPPPGVGDQAYARLMSAAMKRVLKRLPGHR